MNVMLMSLLILALVMLTKMISQIINKKANGLVKKIKVQNAKKSVSNALKDII